VCSSDLKGNYERVHIPVTDGNVEAAAQKAIE
jgi:hypothetical protein